MSNTFIEIHAIQPLPPANPNRDDAGSPKTVIYGGIQRASISSQSWKKACRDNFAQDVRGIRTRQLPAEVASRMADPASPESLAKAMAVIAIAFNKVKVGSKHDETAQVMASVLADKTLFEAEQAADGEGAEREGKFMNPNATLKTSSFVSLPELEHMVKVADAAELTGTNTKKPWIDDEAAAEALKILGIGATLDLALFGRMVATDPEKNVEAAVAVAHAMGVGADEIQFDSFVASDDSALARGAAHMSTAEFTSSTLYRYAVLDMGQLKANLEPISSESLENLTATFLKTFLTCEPRGKRTSFAHEALPEAVLIRVVRSQPTSLASAFENPVRPGAGVPTSVAAARRLAEKARDYDAGYGCDLVAAYTLGIGDEVKDALAAYAPAKSGTLAGIAESAASAAVKEG